MSLEMELSQREFMARGGVLQMALAKKMKAGEIPKPGEYVWQEYPKEIRISHGFQEVECETEVGNGSRKVYWKENREVIERIVVGSEEEEERVLSGGKTAARLEADRQELIGKARALGIKFDPNWSIMRLRREMGDKLGAVETQEQLTALVKERDALRRMAEMQDEIEALRAQLSGKPSEIDSLRLEVEQAGVVVDKRWGVARLREELDRATAPHEAA